MWTVPVRLQFGRKSFASNKAPQPCFFAFLKFTLHCFDVKTLTLIPCLHSFCRHVDLLPSKIVNIFKACLEILKILLLQWRHIRQTTEQKITKKTKFITKQHLWCSVTGSPMDSTAVLKQEQWKLQIPILLIFLIPKGRGYLRWYG